MRYPGLVLFFLLHWQQSVAQVSFESFIDSNKLLIGDQRLLHLRVKGPADLRLDTISFAAWLTLGIEMLSSQSWQSKGTEGFSQILKIAAFDTGYIKLPPLMLPYQSGELADTAYSNDLALEVSGVMVDSTGLAPIKPILKEPFTFRDAIPYLIVLALGLLVIGYITLRKKKSIPPPLVVEIPIPPDELALADLGKLSAKKLWQEGKIKEYQTELTHIIRAYIEARFHLPALESTTSELLEFDRLRQLSKDLQEDLDQILNIADLIKFAKAQPDIGIHDQFMQKAEHFVRATRETKSRGDV